MPISARDFWQDYFRNYHEARRKMIGDDISGKEALDIVQALARGIRGEDKMPNDSSKICSLILAYEGKYESKPRYVVQQVSNSTEFTPDEILDLEQVNELINRKGWIVHIVRNR